MVGIKDKINRINNTNPSKKKKKKTGVFVYFLDPINNATTTGPNRISD